MAEFMNIYFWTDSTFFFMAQIGGKGKGMGERGNGLKGEGRARIPNA